tara:strand:- start:90 stop:1175 length:1086 start_codon:yes stop_codon:yes gene_type:complete
MSIKKISQLNSLTSNEVTSSIDLLAIVDTTNTETKKITVDNLLSGSNYNSGSFSGSFQGDGSGITGVTGEWDGSHNGNASITGSLTVTNNISSSGNLLGTRIVASDRITTPTILSTTDTVTISDNLNVEGKIITVNVTSSGNISSSADVYGVTGSFLHLIGDGSQLTGVESEWDGTLNGNGEITGSLVVTGDITGSNISASGDLYSNYLTTTRDITIGRNATFNDQITTTSGNGTTTYNPTFGAKVTTTATTADCGIFTLQQDKVTTFRFKVGCKENSNPSVGGYWEFLATYTNNGGTTVQLGAKEDIVAHISAVGGLSVALFESNTGTGVDQQQVTVRVTTSTATTKTWYASVEEIIMVN